MVHSAILALAIFTFDIAGPALAIAELFVEQALLATFVYFVKIRCANILPAVF
jgi:hypothetical protein